VADRLFGGVRGFGSGISVLCEVYVHVKYCGIQRCCCVMVNSGMYWPVLSELGPD